MFSPLRLEALAKLASNLSGMKEAARLLGMAHAARQVYKSPLPPVERPEFDRCPAVVRAALSEEAFGAAWQAGAALSTEEALEAALEMAKEMETQNI
jgi:hypothetical protein